ncbi:putative ATP-dependent RNA helicase DHX34 [Thelohanellus kitauei]|uniref:Putative ATP-dependent RNA helicase DHX34 n=1 Tax=Thelohanellus kitauei TaxID=669202 RepID=A0A0C2IM95_THEKT|nr:putative ATP-dependent RNA helicase DHX34 [Thelohanellus kitauei]
MYSEQDFADFDEFPVPEIKRADLNSLVLQMLSLGLNDVESFPFIESPEVSGITCAIKDLKIRNAISENNEITFLGKAMASLPLEPSVGAILLYGSFLDMVITHFQFRSTKR